MTTLYLPYTFSTSGCGSGIWGYDPRLAQKRIDKVREVLSSVLGCKTAACLSNSDKFAYNPRTNRYEITHSIAVACLRMNVARARQTLLLSQPEYTTITIRAIRAYILDRSRKLKRIVSRTFTEIMSRTDVQIVCLDHKPDVCDDSSEFENGSLTIEVSGLWQSVECARISVLVFLDELAGLFVDTLTIEAYLHPIIAGRKRVALNSIMHDTLTNIYFPTPLIGVKDVPYRFVSTIYITGSPENVQAAKTCLEEAAVRHRETTKYLRIPCIPRKLDWLCTEHRDYLFKLMCDNATHITVPPKGSGDPILTLVSSQQIGINRTLRMITRVICTFYVIKIFINQNDSTARVELQAKDPDQADPNSHGSDSRMYAKDRKNSPSLDQLSPPATTGVHSPQESVDGIQLDCQSQYQSMQRNSTSMTFHSANHPSQQIPPHLSGTSYGTPQICHSSEIKFRRMSNNTFKSYRPSDVFDAQYENSSDKIIVYNTQEMNNFIGSRNSLSSHMLIRDIDYSFDGTSSSIGSAVHASSPVSDNMDNSQSHLPQQDSLSSIIKNSKMQIPSDFTSKTMTLHHKAILELLKVTQITGAEIFYERDIITVYGNELVIKRAHKLMAQLEWLSSIHRLIVYQLELAAENREFVNGKKNGKINKIVKASGCNIVFQEPYNDYNVLIEVQANQFSRALEGLSYLENEIPAETSFYIPESYHRRIIGVSGKNVQKIMKKFAVYIKFTNAEEFESLGGYFENIDNVIARTPAKNVHNLESLRAAVFEQLGSSYKQRTTSSLAISHALYRLVIGRQACNLRDITCCCDVQIVFPYKEVGSDHVYITGTESQVSLATDMFAKLIPKIHSFKIPSSLEAPKSLLRKFFELTYYPSSSGGVEIHTSAPSHVISMRYDQEDLELYVNLIYMPSKHSEMERVESEILNFFSGNPAHPLQEEPLQNSELLNIDISSASGIPTSSPPTGLLSPCQGPSPSRPFNMYNCFDYKLLPFPVTCEEDTNPATCCVSTQNPDDIADDVSLSKPIPNNVHMNISNVWAKYCNGNEYDQPALPLVPPIPYTAPENGERYIMQAPRPHCGKNSANNLVPPYYVRNGMRSQTSHPTSYVYPRMGQTYIQAPFYYIMQDTEQQRKVNQPRYMCEGQNYNGNWPVQDAPPSMNTLPYPYDDGVNSYVPQDVDNSIQQLVAETSDLSISASPNGAPILDPRTKVGYSLNNPNGKTVFYSQNSEVEDLDVSRGLSSSSMLQRLASDFFLTTPSNDEKEPQPPSVSPGLRKLSACQSFFSEEACLHNTINGDSNHSLSHTHQTPQRVSP